MTTKLLEALTLAEEALESIVKANWREWEELADPEEFVRWAKSRAGHSLAAIRAALVDSVDTSLERVEKTAKSIHIAPTNSCQKPTELVETDCGGAHHHRYAGSFGD